MRVFAGDVVPKKKPDPAIYELAATALGAEPARYAKSCYVWSDAHPSLHVAGLSCEAPDHITPCIHSGTVRAEV